MNLSKYLHLRITHLGTTWRRIAIFLIALFAVIGLQHFVVAPSFSNANSTAIATSAVTIQNRDRLIAQDSNTATENSGGSTTIDYNSLTEEQKAAFNNIMLVAGSFGIVAYIFTSFCLMKIADKLSIPNSWLAWVPIAQIWVMVRAAGKPGWWLILFFIPFINFVIGLIVLFTIPTSLNKSSLYGLLIFIPILGVFLYFGLLAFT